MRPYYQDDDATIYNADCCEVFDLLPPIDLTVTSPPYDNLRTYDGYTFDFEAIAQGLWRVTKPGGVVVWVVADETVDGSESGTSFQQALRFKELGFRLYDTMLYLKNQLSFPHPGRYLPGFEYMFVLSKGAPRTVNLIKDRRNISVGRKVHGTERTRNGTLRPTKAGAGNRLTDLGVRWNYWLIFNQRRGPENEHPATFPEALANDHIRTWANAGDLVLDPMMGSGTTWKAARQNGCKFIGIEISERYCEIAVNRLSQQTLNFGEKES